MLKRDLVNSVSDKIEGHLKKDISQAIDIILESITDALAEDRRVEIRGFGSLCVRMRKSRSTKNPRTSKMMHIPARKTVHFTMSKSIKDPLVKNDTANEG
ncbi:MAG: integration host factor subunit beta [Desulfobulbaceae bacterium]|nr:integration host factor subunit beta [Desulfobulbaceae bacterium]